MPDGKKLFFLWGAHHSADKRFWNSITMKGRRKMLARLFLFAFALWVFIGFEYNDPGYEKDVGLWLPFIKHRPSLQIKFESQLSMHHEILDSIPLSDSDIKKYSSYCSIRFGKNLEDCYNILEDAFAESVNSMRDKGDEYSPVYYEIEIKRSKAERFPQLDDRPVIAPVPALEE